jgi:hypothetical protein
MHQWKPEEKRLACARRLRLNVRSFTHNGLMTRKKFLLPDFDACSVALFAALVFMGPVPSRLAHVTPVRAALVSTRSPDGVNAQAEPADTREDDAAPETEQPHG